MGQPSSPVPWEGHEGVPCWTFRPLPDYVVAGHKGQPEEVTKRGGSDGAAGWQARRDAARWKRTSHRSSA